MAKQIPFTEEIKNVYTVFVGNILTRGIPGHSRDFNRLNAKLNPTCHLLALLGAHPILHISRIRVNIQKDLSGTV
jgi:hypothetical protein